MGDQAALFGASGRSDATEVLADLEVDYTPVGVAVQLLLALVGNFTRLSIADAILDPSAGSGVWGRAVRAVYRYFEATHPPTTYGSDIRASERANVRAAYDSAHGLPFAELVDRDTHLSPCLLPRFDAVITNPPFSAFESGWWLELLRRGLLADRGVVAFLGLSQWGQSQAAEALLREWSPALQIRCGGRIAYRGNGKADAREYSLWVWSTTHGRCVGPARPRWEVDQLPVLPTSLRRWNPEAVPGTYPIAPALVEQIAEDYL